MKKILLTVAITLLSIVSYAQKANNIRTYSSVHYYIENKLPYPQDYECENDTMLISYQVNNEGCIDIKEIETNNNDVIPYIKNRLHKFRYEQPKTEDTLHILITFRKY